MLWEKFGAPLSGLNTCDVLYPQICWALSSTRARTKTCYVAISISSAVFCPFMRDPRRTSSKVDHEVQGLNGVMGFIPLMEKVLANLRLRVNIFDHLETKKKAVNLVVKKRKEEKKVTDIVLMKLDLYFHIQEMVV